MTTPDADRIRAATAADVSPLLQLWALLFPGDAAQGTTWQQHAHDWFIGIVEDRTAARFPVIEVDGSVVATAIGTLELGVPNLHWPPRANRAAGERDHLPSHRGRGHGIRLPFRT